MSKNINKKNSLGRGLDALITPTLSEVDVQGSSSFNEINLEDIIPNPEQPREEFDPEALEELAQSIRHLGIIQPITVHALSDNIGKYRIISGERRYRAAKIAGLERIPAYIRTAEDEQIMEMALIENIQRQDLNAIEVALAFKKLIEGYDLTQEELSNRVGKKRATISNYIRLLKLPAEIQMGLKDNKVSMGHARSLLGIDDPEVQLAFYEQVIADHISVRSLEQMVKDYNEPEEEIPNKPRSSNNGKRKPTNSEEVELLTNRFRSLFGTKVTMTLSEQGKGKINIPFESNDQLEHILALLDRL
ncbi:ParB/RepB/Spo0J family partition protein [uncultured Porphyromonas sp.]|uniref:ParB/RepB/Spo0J family partition protein n=1 Tax=uncultured Porphyromonas sp. TaxID=159274 RepID=UPI00259AF3A7|nr:ParB/RepB/Spo0J family partition protein [uncultured Porphyromonas sp.]